MSIFSHTTFKLAFDERLFTLALLSGGDPSMRMGPSTEIPEIASHGCSLHSFGDGLTTKPIQGHAEEGFIYGYRVIETMR